MNRKLSGWAGGKTAIRLNRLCTGRKDVSQPQKTLKSSNYMSSKDSGEVWRVGRETASIQAKAD